MLDEARELITWMFYFPRVIAKIMPEPFAVRLHAFNGDFASSVFDDRFHIRYFYL